MTDPATHRPSSSSTSAWLALMPMLFVVLWSTGFIAAKYGLPYAPPLTFLILRFLVVSILLVPLVLLVRAPWPTDKAWHIAVSGVLLHAGYLAGVWCAIKLGMPAGLSALIVGLQPVLTAFAAPLVGERVRGRQWLGLVLGLSGVGLVVANKISLVGLTLESIVCCVIALFSITIGTLYQKRHCPHFDLRSGTLIQYVASLLAILPLAIWFEDWTPAFAAVEWTPEFIGALLWSVLALSIGAIFVLFALIRRSAATSVTSLLYLTPPTTAAMAWLAFGEVFSMVGLLGMVLAVLGVAFVVSKSARSD